MGYRINRILVQNGMVAVSIVLDLEYSHLDGMHIPVIVSLEVSLGLDLERLMGVR